MELDSNLCPHDDFTKLKVFEVDLMKPNVWYTININPDDDHQWFDHPTRGTQFYNYLRTKLIKLNSSSTVAVILEPSDNKIDNNKRSRLHLHGVIKFSPTGLAKWYMHHKNMLTKFSSISLHLVKNDKTWKNYCLKNEYFLKNVFSPYYSIPYPFYDPSDAWTTFAT